MIFFPYTLCLTQHIKGTLKELTQPQCPPLVSSFKHQQSPLLAAVEKTNKQDILFLLLCNKIKWIKMSWLKLSHRKSSSYRYLCGFMATQCFPVVFVKHIRDSVPTPRGLRT